MTIEMKKKTLDPATTLITIVIPVYNEVETIRETLQAVLATPYRKEVVVIDDGSTDGTMELLKTFSWPDLVVLFHEKNKGKGRALQTGFEAAQGDIVLIQDADLEYDPGEYSILLQPIFDGKADVVYGSRFAGHGAHRVLYFWHYVGNRFLTLLSNLFTNLNLTDMETCYKVFRREVLAGISIREKRFGVEPELTAKLSRVRGVRIYEVPISYYGRTYEEGKKIGWRDGVSALRCILRYNLLGD